MKSILSVAFCLLALSAQGQYALQRYDVNPGPMWSSTSMAFTDVNGRIYFMGETGTRGKEVSRINGNAVEAVSDIQPGPAHSIYHDFTYMPVVDGKVYFVAIGFMGWRLYAIDDATNTVSVVDLTGTKLVEISGINNVIDIKGKLYFAGMDAGGHDEIYCYDPASKKLERISDLTNVAADPEIAQLTNYNGLLAFTFDSPATGRELCILDPVSRWQRTYDINQGTASSYPRQFTVYRDKLYMRAQTADHGYELYSYSPLVGPVRLTDIAQGAANSLGGVMDRNHLIGYKNGIIFSATANGAMYDLYRYDVSAKTTSIIGNFNAAHTEYLFAAAAEYGGKLFMSLDSGIAYNNRMYVYDGVNPPYRVGQLVNGANIKGVTCMKVCDNKLVFDANVLPFLDGEVYTLTDSAVLNAPGVTAGKNLAVYPNPAHTELRVSVELKQATSLRITLTDVQGRVVYNVAAQYAAGNQEIAVPVHELAAGVYVYMLRNSDGVVLGSGKVLKK